MDPSKAYRAAQRHSKLVHVARWGIVAASAVFAAVLLTDVMSTSRTAGRLRDASRVQIVGTDAIIGPAGLSGSLARHGAFKIECKAARQNLAHLDVIDLRRVTAKIHYDNARWVVSAPHGQIDRRDETLSVDGGVRIENMNGDVLSIESAVLDTTSGSLRAADFGNALNTEALATMFALLK